MLIQTAHQLKHLDAVLSDPAKGLPDRKSESEIAALIEKEYPRAKQELIADGYPPKQVEAMPVAQVVAMQQVRAAKRIYDEMFKNTLLDYPQAQQRLEETEAKLKGEGHSVLQAVFSLLPALRLAVLAQARVDRQIAALRAIEAVRMHAAINGGRIPRSLNEVTVVPVPDDPLTAKPFPYRLDGSKAILQVPAPPRSSKSSQGWVYEIGVVPAQKEPPK